MKIKFRLGDLVWLLAAAAFFSIFVIPQTKEVSMAFIGNHPFIAGFIKYFILASMGELLAQRIAIGEWKKTKGFVPKAFFWGIIGVVITFMFTLFPFGVQAMIDKGLIPIAAGYVGTLLTAFYTSIVANCAFGPIFMAVHRISDAKIEAAADKKKMSIMDAVRSIDWVEFIRFIVGKTIPIFWVPALTITFLIPTEYRILFAAALSIALGVILTVAKRKKSA
ncbi:MAG: hypothetical protein AB1Z23_09805 [Eubacteriales bacterium]